MTASHLYCILIVIGHFHSTDTWSVFHHHHVHTPEDEAKALEKAKEQARGVLKSTHIDIIRIVRYMEDAMVGQIQG